jgi:hypothetical protein
MKSIKAGIAVTLFVAGISTALADDPSAPKTTPIVVSGGVISNGKTVLWIVSGTSVTQCTYVDGSGAPGCATKTDAFK